MADPQLPILPAVPSSCCTKFWSQAELEGRTVVTVVTPSGLRNKRTRDLTVAEARRIVSFLVCRGDLELSQPYTEFKCKNTPGLEITSPPLERKWPFYTVETEEVEENGKKKKVTKVVYDKTKDFMGPERIGIKAVVRFTDLPGRPSIALNNLNTTQDPQTQVCLNLDFRNVVGLYKLLEILVRDFGATEMLHAGIGAGRGPCTDCHNTGRAIDFSGLKGSSVITPGSPAEAYDIRVMNDWGTRPIKDDSGKVAGAKDNNIYFWPAGATPFFRLTSKGIPAPGSRDLFAIRIFTSVFDFSVAEYVDKQYQCGAGYSGSGQPPATPSSTTTQIGMGSFSLNPDAPGGNSKAHFNHMHFQIGWTGLEDNYSKILGNPSD